MIEIGTKQKLIVVKHEDFGIYLGESRSAGPEERILLPKKQVPPDTKDGDTLEVFIYLDSDDRKIATVNEPAVTLHHTATLRVRQMTKIGAFLDWGLEKDLLLPFHEQTKTVHEGEEVLVALYVDKSERLAATMLVYPYLETDSPYHEGDEVEGLVYQLAHNFGVFIAVDRKYSGLIPKQEAQGDYEVGQTLSLRVTKVLEDGKLNLSAQKKAYLQLDIDADEILTKIRDDYDGDLPFSDKADPDTIKDVFGLSKAAFKRAVGHLYKNRKIEITDGRIHVI